MEEFESYSDQNFYFVGRISHFSLDLFILYSIERGSTKNSALKVCREYTKAVQKLETPT